MEKEKPWEKDRRGQCGKQEVSHMSQELGAGMHKVVIVKRRTRLEELKRRYNTVEQAKFYVEHLGADFSDYEVEHTNYYAALATARVLAGRYARVQEIDRDYIPNMIFGAQDIVVAVGQDGLVANVMKYLDGQPLVGVNPDVKRWEGQLLPFEAGDLELLLPKVIAGNQSEKRVTMGKAETADGQVLYAVNDFFIGVNNHTSARYHMCYNGIVEQQSSSGVIVSTGLGMTGWHASVMAQFRGMARVFLLECVPERITAGGTQGAGTIQGTGMTQGAGGICGTGTTLGAGGICGTDAAWDAGKLIFQVREPYPSRYTQAELVYGQVTAQDSLSCVSDMAENGVVFSDGILNVTIEFNAGTKLTVCVADRVGRLVTG